MLLFTVEVRPHRAPAGQFFNRRRVTFDFGKGRARGQAQLLGEDIKDAGETNQRRVFGDGSARELAEIEFALFRRCGHRANLTTNGRANRNYDEINREPKNLWD